MESVRAELIKRGLANKINNSTTWIAMLKLLKDNENNNKYFKYLTNYDAFKWNCNQVGPDGKLL